MGNRSLAFLVIVMMVLINVNTAGAGVEPSPFDWNRSFQAFSPSNPEVPQLIVGFDPQPEPPGYEIIGFDPQPEPPGVIQFGITLFDPQPEPPGLGFGFLGTGLSIGQLSALSNEVRIKLLDSAGSLTYDVRFAFDTGGMNPNLLYPFISSFDPQPEPPGIPSPNGSEFITFSFLLYDNIGALPLPGDALLLSDDVPSPFVGDAVVTFSLYNAGGTLIPVAPVPEPSTFLLLGAGLAGIGLLRRRFKN